MPMLNINGTRVKVDDSFLSMTPEQQNATVDEIAGSLSGQSRPADLPAPGAASFVQGLAEGIPVVGPSIMKGADMLAAGINSIASGQPYSDELAKVAGAEGRAVAAHPYMNTAGQVAGGVAGTLPLVMAAPAAFGAGSAGLVARTLASAASGGALGAADSAARSGGDPNAALHGAEWGFGLGAVAPGIGSAVGAGTRALANRLASGASRAEQAFGRAMGSDAVSDPVAALAAKGPEAMPMDLGPNLQRQAGALAATPGRGQEIIRSAIADRQAGAGARVSQSLDEVLGRPVDTIARADEIIARRSQAAKPLYDAAYAKPVPFTRELEDLLRRPAVGKALKKAQGLAADEGIPSRQWFANISDDGTVALKNVPDVRQLDLTKRALDDMISSAQRQGNNNEARIYTQLKNRLTDLVDEAVPEYAQARAAFSGPSGVLDAMEEGQKAFRNSLTPNQMRTHLMKLSDAEKEAYIEGARTQIADMMGTARNDALKVRGEFQKGHNREKLNLLIGKEQADKLLNSLESETAFARTRDIVTGNSETAARLAAQADVGAGARGPGALEQAANLNFGTAAMRMGDKLLGGARSAAQGRTNEELAGLLTSRDPKAITRAIKTVQAAQRRGDISAQRSREIVNALVQSMAQRRPLELTVTPSRVP